MFIWQLVLNALGLLALTIIVGLIAVIVTAVVKTIKQKKS